MAKPVPGSNNLQAAIDNAFATMQRAIKGQSNEMDMLAHLATCIQQLAAGTKQALQAIYDEVD